MSEVKPVYLVMITANNNNKYYNCFPNDDGTFTVKYGRIGGGEQTKVYPMSKWKSQINSKIKKGYVDRTDLMEDVIEDSKVEESKTPLSDKFSLIKIESVRNIVKRLYDYANHVIQSAYRVTATETTQAAVDKAQEQIDFIALNYKSWDVDRFNEELLKLFAIIPRKMGDTRGFLAQSDTQFADIVQREQDTLDTMAGQVYQRKKVVTDNLVPMEGEEPVQESMLDEMGITMRDTTPEEVEIIKKAMGDQAGKYYNSWAVTNIDTQNSFDKFVSENKIDNIRLLCHGSRNQNYFNILKIGLKIRPANAGYNGSMLGDACYFSNPDKEHGGVAKSIGYTSLRGSYWASGSDSSAFLTFFDVALGKSYDIYSFDSRFYSYNLKKLQEDCPGAWSLHLHGAGYRNGSTVINDEITVYDTRQMTIRYLVEIR